MRRVACTLVLPLALLVAGCDGGGKAHDRAAVAPGVLASGQVTHQGAPVEGAFVILASRTTGEAPDLPASGLFTDAGGAFSIHAPGDVYDVVVVHPDGLVGEGTLDLGAGPATLDVVLREAETDASKIGPGALQRLLSLGSLEADPSLLSEED
ncbi:MAG: carboxypeptidase regulatory-like domain-containing protein [Planctomycetes bacterium]|nr:carboxypeptidase regulatory-like domain-containing protein [Planctomycetota bacterium]